MKDRRTHLKVKIKALAAESRIIRDECRKIPGDTDLFRSLDLHRRLTVREETRHALLAYCVIRGVPYAKIEEKCSNAPQFTYVDDLAKRFGADKDTRDSWLVAARTYIRGETPPETTKPEVTKPTGNLVSRFFWELVS